MVWRFVLILILSLASALIVKPSGSVHAQDNPARLITVYDRGTTRVFLSKEKTIGAALKAEHIDLDKHDTVEPSVNQALIASDYHVNIYRARPVIVVDGATRIKTISPYQTAEQIAKDVGVTIYEGDLTTLQPLTNFVRDGAGLELTILRATPISLNLYGKETAIRTQGKTVGDMLKEKRITLGPKDRVSLPLATPITSGMEVRVWREGVQTVSVDQPIAAGLQIVYDADQPLGYRVTQTKGMAGNMSIAYQVEVKDGVEISRVQIASIATKQPTNQVDIIGLRNDGGGLTKSKGAQYWTDSKGISHRETYYDLNMHVVMYACGQGGYYTVRPDGVKVDADGYVIVAANLSNYPKCTMVETSLGPAKVYDTGGFASRYPYGFDIATDWSNPDGV
jgi:uncharacterized protein YabE (DUF348 family)